MYLKKRKHLCLKRNKKCQSKNSAREEVGAKSNFFKWKKGKRGKKAFTRPPKKKQLPMPKVKIWAGTKRKSKKEKSLFQGPNLTKNI